MAFATEERYTPPELVEEGVFWTLLSTCIEALALPKESVSKVSEIMQWEMDKDPKVQGRVSEISVSYFETIRYNASSCGL